MEIQSVLDDKVIKILFGANQYFFQVISILHQGKVPKADKVKM
jgi:hypothetical protein